MRAALGAGRLQIVRQLLIEAVLLSLIAGALGLAFGSLAANLVGSFQVPTDLPLVFDFHLDLRVVLFTVATSLLAGVAFGLLPALRDLPRRSRPGPQVGADAERCGQAVHAQRRHWSSSRSRRRWSC